MNVNLIVQCPVFIKVFHLLWGNLFQTAHDPGTRNSVLSTFSAFRFYWGNFFSVLLMLCSPVCFALHLFFSFWNHNFISVLTLCKQVLFVKSKSSFVKFLVSCCLVYLKHCVIGEEMWYKGKYCCVWTQSRLPWGFFADVSVYWL
jgi:hypothetical protein